MFISISNRFALTSNWSWVQVIQLCHLRMTYNSLPGNALLYFCWVFFVFVFFFWEICIYLNRGLRNHPRHKSLAAVKHAAGRALVGCTVPEPSLGDGAREAADDDGTQGLKSKSTMEDNKDKKLLFSNQGTKSKIIVLCTVKMIVFGFFF